MNTIDINIDWVDRNFGAAVADERMACVATGKTLDDVERNIVEGLKFHIEGMLMDGDVVPPEYLGDWTPAFHLTTRAQLRYADAYITRKALARETGINEQQLCHYANGRKTPRPDTRRRILEGIQAISKRLSLIL
jgi:predicted RNase H-like HicB family nuclease